MKARLASGSLTSSRYGVMTDPFGHNGSLATHVKDLTPADIQAS
jgi:hypothetical protein